MYCGIQVGHFPASSGRFLNETLKSALNGCDGVHHTSVEVLTGNDKDQLQLRVYFHSPEQRNVFKAMNWKLPMVNMEDFSNAGYDPNNEFDFDPYWN